jgi:phage FluMu protein Com
MKESIHCQHCNAILGNVNLRKLLHVEIQCADCGEWSTFDYDPETHVFKVDDTPETDD